MSLEFSDKISLGTHHEPLPEQGEDFNAPENHLSWVPQALHEINSRDNSSISLNTTSIIILNDLNFQDERLAPMDTREDPFACFSEMTQAWISKAAQLREEESDLNDQMASVHDIYMELQKSNIRDYFNSEIKEINKLKKSYSSCEDYMFNIQEVDEISSKLEPRIRELENNLEKELQVMRDAGIPQEVVQTFKKVIDTEIQAIREIPKRQIDKITEEAFAYFYNNHLDAYPDLHPHLGGFKLEKQLCYLSSDIFHFIKQNNEIHEKGAEALLSCSFKLQDALSMATFDASMENSGQTAEIMQKKIHDLPIGETLIFRGCGQKHAILYEIIRESNNYFTFTIINTGDDEKDSYKRKPIGFSRIFMDKNQYGHKSYLVPPSALDVDFLKTITPKSTQRIPTCDLVQQIDQSLLARGGKHKLGRIHHPQHRRNCTAKAPASWLKEELIRKLGPAEGKALYLQFKLFRAQNNYVHLLQLMNNVPQEHLKQAFSRRTYAEQLDPSEDPIIVQEIPATDEELVEHFEKLHAVATATFDKWEKKFNKARKGLKG